MTDVLDPSPEFQTEGSAAGQSIQPASKPDSSRTCVALLGQRDTPTDGVEDYCTFLGKALAGENVQLRNERVLWTEKGWLAALRWLWVESANWREGWVLLQYTAMAWSQRGFPFGAMAVMSILRQRGVRCAVVFHEPFRQNGERWIDLLRGRCQEWIIRRLYAGAIKAVFLDPLEKIPWLLHRAAKATFIPIGANIPEGPSKDLFPHERSGIAKTVAVFCLSDAPNRHRELGDIAHAVRFAAQQGANARVVFLGRGTAEANKEIEELFDSTAGQVVNLGLRSADEVRQILSESDAMLCVRGPLYMRRGSAIAGLACGLPIVGYAGEAEGTPLEDAGVELVPYPDRDALGKALAKVLANEDVLSELRRKSLSAQRQLFSWNVIASKMLSVLDCAKERVEA
jgi:glycosyltransferase involved in cell wall biosynthesis